MTIYKKLSEARAAFHKLELKKSGHNKFAGYRYFELADFVQPGMQCLADAGLVPVVSFTDAEAVMTVHEIDGEASIAFRSPMSTAALKGCHEVQNLGAVQTYLRRYLWIAALEIIEHDAVDGSQQVEPERISESQITDLEALMDEVQVDGVKFMRWLKTQFKVGDLSELTVGAYPHVVEALERKRKAA